MVSVQIATLVVALLGAGDTVLLDFHAAWCGPCQSMKGTIAELERAGYPIRRVDTDRQRALADRFGVQSIPCFVLLVDGKEVGRLTGASRRSELLDLFARAGVKPGTHSGIARAQSPDRSGPSPQPSTTGGVTPQRLIKASVRLKVEDPTGSSYGSGTLIDARQGEALVLTCGHIFRESDGKGRILVDLFGSQAPQQLLGRLVAYDLDKDIGLVSIRPGVPVEVAPVAPKGTRVGRGEKVITVGCNNGGPATAIYSQINSIDKFLGPPNVQVAGLPVEGRSGGGLFTTDGLLIGVCNAADPADNEGLYAAVASIHEQLDRFGLTAVYAARPGPSELAGARAVRPATSGSVPEVALAGGPDPRQLATTSAPAGAMSQSERATLAELRKRTEGAEVICIIRSLNAPNAPSEVIRLDHASPAFLKQLAVDHQAQDARHLTSLELPARRTPPPIIPARGVRWSSSSTEPTDRVLR